MNSVILEARSLTKEYKQTLALVSSSPAFPTVSFWV